MFISFIPDKARPLCARPYLIPSIYLTCIAASLLPEGRVRAITGIAGLGFLIAQIPKYTQGSVAEDNLLPIQAGLMLLHWVDFFVFSQDEADKPVRLGDQTEGQQKTFRQKLGWSFDLCTSMRGVGWNWQVKNVPVAETKISKWWVPRYFPLASI
jgi:hypothetical protein